MLNIDSWGWGCAEEPGVYARIQEGYDWIKSNVCKLSSNPPANFDCDPAPSTNVEIIDNPVTDVQNQEQQTQQATKKPSESIISLVNEENDPSNYFSSASSRPRQSLPSGTSCRQLTDPEVCCSARDSSSAYRDQYCIPAIAGQKFSSGSICEPIGWVKENVVNRASLQEGMCEAIMGARKIKLPRHGSCSRMMSTRACCMTQDDEGNVCIPAKGFTRFSTGNRCETSAFVAQDQPTNAASC